MLSHLESRDSCYTVSLLFASFNEDAHGPSMMAAVLPSWNWVWMKFAAPLVSCNPFGHLAYQVSRIRYHRSHLGCSNQHLLDLSSSLPNIHRYLKRGHMHSEVVQSAGRQCFYQLRQRSHTCCLCQFFKFTKCFWSFYCMGTVCNEDNVSITAGAPYRYHRLLQVIQLFCQSCCLCSISLQPIDRRYQTTYAVVWCHHNVWALRIGCQNLFVQSTERHLSWSLLFVPLSFKSFRLLPHVSFVTCQRRLSTRFQKQQSRLFASASYRKRSDANPTLIPSTTALRKIVRFMFIPPKE